MRSKKAFYNMLAALVGLVVSTVTSFIVPHYIILAYGSGVNGLITSITQFLSYIALLESGITAIGRASLYKPLAERDTLALSRNVRALEGFYRKVAYIFLGYLVILAIGYPYLVDDKFSWQFTATLVLIIGFSTFVQYYFGITNYIILVSDQCKYIPELLQAGTLLLNMIMTVVLISLNAPIHVVKIVSTAAFTIRPMAMYFYVIKKYHPDRKAEPNHEVLKQRWDGLAQHIAYFVHKNTDVVVLTILSTVEEVSVYSVYMLAVSGCSKVVNIISSELEPAFGNIIARGERKILENRVSICTLLTMQATVIIFTTAGLAMTPFILLYTKGVTDVDYVRPMFGVLMLVAEGIHCMRLPYQAVVYAMGHFRQTRNGAIAEAAINLIISIALVPFFGIMGVAAGTAAAMAFRSLQYIIYYYRKVLGKNGIFSVLRLLAVSIAEIFLIILIARFLPAFPIPNYLIWVIYSAGMCAMCSVVSVVFTLLFYPSLFRQILGIALRVLKK